MSIEQRGYISRADSGWVTAAGIILLAVGILTGLFALVFFIFGFGMGQFFTDVMQAQPELPPNVSAESFGRMMTAILTGVGIVMLVWAILEIAAGIGVLLRRGWGRILGIVISGIGTVFGLIGVIGVLVSTTVVVSDPSFSAAYGGTTVPGIGLALNLLFTLPFLVGYVVVLIALIQNGAAFRRLAAPDPGRETEYSQQP